jgi:sodium-independent sulfate anion transporter 11
MVQNKHAERVKRLLGIDPDQTLADPTFYDDGVYLEEEPSIRDVLLGLIPTIPGTVRYLRELFPFIGWIFHYNLIWLLGDVIAGECAKHPK